jgi:thiamine pyrophosphokinase
VDDVEYTPNTDCIAESTTTTTAGMTTTEPSYPVSALDCNFDAMTTCNWINDTTADFQWTLNQDETLSGGTGPSVDHTTNSNNGHYIYIEASSPRKFNDTARLLSPYVTLGESSDV